MNEEPQGPAGGKPTEFWLLSIRDIVEKALERHEKQMCNIIKTTTPGTVELSKEQHSETMEKIDKLCQVSEALTKAMYVGAGVIAGLSCFGIGAIIFAVFVLTK